MSTILLSGTAKWAKVRKPVKAYDEKSEEFTIDLYPTDKALVDFKRSGIQLKDRNDDSGALYITFRRKLEEMNYSKGEIQVNGPPQVYLKDAVTGEYNKWPEGLIGNGSEVTIAVDAYKTKNGIGHRLLRVFVDKLVVFEGTSEKNAPEQSDLPF